METLRELTELEKAALTYKYYNGVKSYEPAYIMSHPRQKEIKPSTLKSAVSHWKLSPEVQNYMNETQTRDRLRIARLATQARNETPNTGNNDDNNTTTGTDYNGTEKGGGTIAPNWTNFTDLREFLRFCETQANLLTDEKDRQTYLKMIADLMRYKDQDKETNDVQRFYTPLQCNLCPLYNNTLHK